MKKSKHILTARSKSDGIVFYSKTVHGLGLEAFYDEDGKIQTRKIPTQLDEFSDFLGTICDTENEKFSEKHILIIDFIVLTLGITLGILLKNFGIFLAALYFFGNSKSFFNVVNLTYSMKFTKSKNYYTGKFHSAEHMVCNAYEKLKRIPNLEEVKRFSRFHKRCGSCSALSNFFFITSFTFCVLFLFELPFYVFIISSILIIFIVDIKLRWLRFMQILVTNKPSEKELVLAIEGLEAFEKMEELAKEDLDLIILEPPHDLFRAF